LTVGVAAAMLARMPHPSKFVRCAFVAAIALTLVACSRGPVGPTPPPQPILRPGPTPAKVVDPDAKYADAMIAKFASDPLILHAVETVKMTASSDTDSVKMTASTTIDLSGDDMKLHSAAKLAGKTTKFDVVVVGRSVYTRVGSAPWGKEPRSGWKQTLDDLVRDLNPARKSSQLRYVGVETIDKLKLHHLTAVGKFPYVMADGQRGTYEKFDVWVKEDGTPVLAKGKISVIGAYGIEVKGTSELRFSKFGGTIKVTAPKT
jgi:hypothetical protein